MNVLASGRPQTGNIATWDRTMNKANDGNSGYCVHEIDMGDLVRLKGTKVNNIETRVGRLVFPDDSGVIVLTSDNLTDKADLGETTARRRIV